MNKPEVITHFTFTDGFFVATLLIITVFSSLFTYKKLTDNQIAVVEINGTSENISLAHDKVVDLGNGIVLEVKDGRVRVKDSDCKQKICVKHGWLRSYNDVIVCVPNRTIIYIPQDSTLDYITR